MNTFAHFRHKGRKVHIFKYGSFGPRGQTFYRAALDDEDLPLSGRTRQSWELTIKKLLDED